MHQRGSVRFLDHEYHAAYNDNIVVHNHSFVTLLQQELADACGHQLLFKGTGLEEVLNQPVTATEKTDGSDVAELKGYPPIFTCDWTSLGGATGRTGWYPETLTPIQLDSPIGKRGTITSMTAFEAGARRRCEALLINEDTAEKIFKPLTAATSRCPRSEILQDLQPGDVLRVEGQEVLVVSNAAFHKYHPHSHVLVVPLADVLSASTAPASLSFLQHGKRRAILELAQSIVLSDKVQCDRVSRNEDAPEKLGRLRHALASLMTLGTVDGVSTQDIVSYLRASRSARRGQSLLVSSLRTPAIHLELTKGRIRARRRTKPIGRGDTPSGSTSMLAGTDDFYVIKTALVGIYIIRSGDTLKARVEPRCDTNEGDFEHVWARIEADRYYVSKDGSAANSYGSIDLPLPRAVADATITISVGATCLMGHEEHTFDLCWMTPT